MIWLISDTHFGLKGDNPIWMQDIYDYFDKVLFPLMEEKVKPEDILIHCGDVFDNRSTIGLNTDCLTFSIR
jgi:DNA repair exonuclease SbcCD nuclease subunit